MCFSNHPGRRPNQSSAYDQSRCLEAHGLTEARRPQQMGIVTVFFGFFWMKDGWFSHENASKSHDSKNVAGCWNVLVPKSSAPKSDVNFHCNYINSCIKTHTWWWKMGRFDFPSGHLQPWHAPRAQDDQGVLAPHHGSDPLRLALAQGPHVPMLSWSTRSPRRSGGLKR